MTELPLFALSIRQPWAWAIVSAGKDIENRCWSENNPARRFSGPFCIHAAQGMTKGEYEDAARFMNGIGIRCPAMEALPRGGIVGTARLIEIVRHSDSPWFMGSSGLVLKDAKAVDFIPAKGKLGFFKWEPVKAVTAGTIQHSSQRNLF